MDYFHRSSDITREAFGREDNLTNGLLFYFGLGILMHAYGQRYTTTKLVTLTSNTVYEKRADLIGEILMW